MITADLHNHTHYSHARDSVADMYASAVSRGLDVFGFSEHSPRPEAYTYPSEYRDRLNAHLADYVREVTDLQKAGGPCRVLFGMEIDWFEDDEAFVRGACSQFPFDYLIGSTHFLGTWGYDAGPGPWQAMSEGERFDCYSAYFRTWRRMLDTGLFNIAAHPDLIKIFTVSSFHSWLVREDSQRLVKDALEVLKCRGMAMEVSSAGLRKPCREIYPCPLIMRLAAETGVRISFASDAHTTDDVAFGFPVLASYARAFGFTESVYFADGTCHSRAF
ncbi:MAG: histidinol-phosphatase [Desulfovibrionaceae bacterium]|nr:histidinol-phosphatase [Desulfovibrionaceae bacterium]